MLETLIKKDPNRASKAFISIVGHITIDELRGSLDHTSMANGYANRFLFACVDRSKELPLGGDDVDLSELIERTRAVVDTARAVERVTMNDSAKALWCEIYSELSTGQPGMLGAITARGEAQTLRLALIYALLDGASEIDRVHIEAGLAMWNYCKASARFIFGDLLGNTTADAILRALRTAGANGMSRTDISDLFGHNRDSGKITRRWSCCSHPGRRGLRRQPHQAAAGGRRRPGTRSDETEERRPQYRRNQVVFRKSVRVRNKSTYCEISRQETPKRRRRGFIPHLFRIISHLFRK